MNRTMCTTVLSIALVALLLGIVPGCATQRLAISDAKILPAKVAPGQEAVLSLKVIDPKHDVKAITATVREFPDISLDLNDSGGEGDKVAGDGVWSYAIEVPYGAPAGTFNWDFEVYDASGNVIKVTEKGEEKALKAEATVEITQ